MKNIMTGAAAFLVLWVLFLVLPVILTAFLYMAISAIALGVMFYVGSWILNLITTEEAEEENKEDEENESNVA